VFSGFDDFSSNPGETDMLMQARPARCPRPAASASRAPRSRAVPRQDRCRWCDRPQRVAGAATVASGSPIKHVTLARHSVVSLSPRIREGLIEP
jgi:hypothetical protein